MHMATDATKVMRAQEAKVWSVANTNVLATRLPRRFTCVGMLPQKETVGLGLCWLTQPSPKVPRGWLLALKLCRPLPRGGCMRLAA